MARFSIDYILNKIIRYLKTYFFTRKKFVDKNLLLINATEQNPKNIKTVLFYFPDIDYMHLGDHLFFEPLARLLKENELRVTVSPAEPMKFYFESLGFDIQTDSSGNFDLIISKPEFINDLSRKKNILIIDTAYAGINKPLIEDLSLKLKNFLGLKKGACPKPQYLPLDGFKEDILEKLSLERNKKYIIFNNYLYSGNYRVFRNKFQRLEMFIQNFLKTHSDYEVVQTGSRKDKDNDRQDYSFVHIDLRGKTSVEDLFRLCAHPSARVYIGFDGFIMHLFFLQHKKAFVMSRGRWSSKARHFLENYIDPPFTPVVPLKEIKEYIR